MIHFYIFLDKISKNSSFIFEKMSLISNQSILFNLRLPDEVILYILDFAPHHREKFKIVLKNLLWNDIHHSMRWKSCDECDQYFDRFDMEKYKFNVPIEDPSFCTTMYFCSGYCEWSYMYDFRKMQRYNFNRIHN